MARGVDFQLAMKLQQNEWTVGKLKQKSLEELGSLGIMHCAALNILAGERPPVPFSNLACVLIANRFTCCVCRNHERSVVVHHIKPWANSHDHSPPNLAVLCLEHHDRAHRTGGLTQNLTSALVRRFKDDWEQYVGHMDALAVLTSSALDSDSWWLFNHVRIFELAASLNIDLSDIQGSAHLRSVRLVGSDGRPTPPHANQLSYFYEGEHGISLYGYTRNVFNAVLGCITALNVSDDLDRGFLTSVLKRGDFVILQGSFSFKPTQPSKDGPGQTIFGKRKANGVEIYFSADRWEATSNSARCVWLGGRQHAVCLLRVISIEIEPSRLRIGGTAIAIGAGLEGIKTREYSHGVFSRGYHLRSYNGDYDDDDDNGDESDGI